MLPRSFVACVSALIVTWGATTAHAQSSPASLLIECPTLDGVARAILEARAEAEIASEGLPDGEIDVTCVAASVRLTWTPKGAAPRERRVELTGERETFGDVILEALHALLFEEPRPAPPPVEIPPQRAPQRAVSPPETVASRPVRVDGVVGTDLELWQGGIGVALGASTGIAVSPWERWTLGATIAPQWGLGSARGISAWGLRGVARVDYAILSQLALGVGVSGRSLWASDPAAATTQLEGTTAGALLSARYVLSIGPVAVSAGPRIEALVRPIIAELAGKEVFRVPSFVAGVTIDGSAP